MGREYNKLNRLVRVLNASSAPTRDSHAFDGSGLWDGYDGNGNSRHSADGLGIETSQSLDPLNRLISTIQDTTGSDANTHDATTSYTYDERDNLRTVEDPSNLTTTYTYDGLNNLTALDSPDTGHTDYTYDGAGNRLTQTDNRGVISTYEYDALNRLTTISYPDTTQNVSFVYDEANGVTGCASSYPVGRLTTMTDNSGSTSYCYDRRGNVRMKTTMIGSTSRVTEYTYTNADRLESITYPSGSIVRYARDGMGRINLVGWKANSSASEVTVVYGVTYYPFGPVNEITFDGRTLTKSYDQDYQIDSVASSDPAGLIIDFTTNVMGQHHRSQRRARRDHADPQVQL